jgi:TonB family protein
MYKAVLFLVSLIFCCNTFAQPKENRVALVMGNSAYKTAPLKNPTNDAKDMAAKLKGMGFTVVERSNLTSKQIGSTLREFRSKLSPGSVALVYYAGHGLQIKGENYFPTVDAEIAGEEDVPNQSLAMRQIMDVLEDAKTRLNLVFLDACRNNPYQRSFRSSSDGLSKVVAPSGTLISFATRPGSVAADGTGRNGLYTGALLEAMDSRSDQIEQVLKRVVARVRAGSKNQQEPWMEGSIDGEFCFGNCLVTEAQTAMSDDRALWDSVKDSRNVNDLKAYLNKFPQGLFAEVAANRIKSAELSATPQPSSPSLPLHPSTQNKEVLSNSNAKVNISKCEKPEYPAIARQLNQQGTVALKFLVGVDGSVLESIVDKTSGFELLDQAALSGLSKCKFSVAIKDGKPIQGWASMRYTWRLE